MTIKISLTQFLTFNSKVSTEAKINYVSGVKYGPEYSVRMDYWKTLRDAIKNSFKNGTDIESISNAVNNVRDDKKTNYRRVSSRMIHFVNSHEIEYFDTGHAVWNFEDKLTVSASPELGFIIDGDKFLVKNYYKKPNSNTKVTGKNIKSTLALMSLAKSDFPINGAKAAVLNLQNEKLNIASPISSNDQLSLNVDAETFVNIWNKI